MEEKIVGEKKGSSLFSVISFTLLSIASPSSVFIYTAPALDLPPHSDSPTKTPFFTITILTPNTGYRTLCKNSRKTVAKGSSYQLLKCNQ